MGLGGLLVDGRGRVVAEGRTDRQLHAFVEDEVAMGPELGRQVGAQPIHLLEPDHLALAQALGERVDVCRCR
jgi:hypothetical protein